jgi:ADP-dependent NAD(P)H-hydrate dehydratase / NAD(P)H-hydrate epimerase
MIPVLTPDEVRALDAASPTPTDQLVARAGHAVFRAALELLGGTYGRRVLLLAGPGHNGADGRVAADHLRRRGIRIDTIDIDRDHPAPPAITGLYDLVIDAVFGTGFRGVFVAPNLADASIPVLAVDVPSGLDAATGLVADGSRVLRATRSVTFAALRVGHLMGRGPELCGRVTVADIGLDAHPSARTALIEESDARARIPSRNRAAHKWSAALGVIAGSPGMTGAPMLASEAAFRGGAGMVRLGIPGGVEGGTEAVGVPLPSSGWAAEAAAMLQRCDAYVIGPGLGLSANVAREVRAVLGRSGQPCVIDGDALTVLGRSAGETTTARARITKGSGSHDEARAMLKAAFTGTTGSSRGDVSSVPMLAGQRAVLQATARRLGADPRAVASAGRAAPDRIGHADLDAAIRSLAGRTAGTTVLTPHDGEFARITGAAPGDDRIASARALAAGTGTVVLLKGPTTVVASPDGWVELVNAGDHRLATAGSGDVLAGVIGAFLAQGLSVMDAAATGAYVHGAAAVGGGNRVGLIASDLPSLVASWLSQ